MKFSEKICLKIILKVKKNQGFSLSLEDKLLEKPQGRGQIEPPTPPPPPRPPTCFRVKHVHCVKSVQIRSFFWPVFGYFSHSGNSQVNLKQYLIYSSHNLSNCLKDTLKTNNL